MARLLLETDTTVAEIDQRVGWRSRHSASETFHRAVGALLGAYLSQRR